MKTFEVVLDKPSKVKDWCLWDNRDVIRECPTTIAIITAFNFDRLKTKLSNLYPDVKILSVKEIIS